MDDFTAAAGLTRGALYHHFGDKKGLLEAVIAADRRRDVGAAVRGVAAGGQSPGSGFVDECIAYIEMALEPEIQRIVLRDGPAVLGDPSQWPNQSECIRSMTESLTASPTTARSAMSIRRRRPG